MLSSRKIPIFGLFFYLFLQPASLFAESEEQVALPSEEILSTDDQSPESNSVAQPPEFLQGQNYGLIYNDWIFGQNGQQFYAFPRQFYTVRNLREVGFFYEKKDIDLRLSLRMDVTSDPDGDTYPPRYWAGEVSVGYSRNFSGPFFSSAELSLRAGRQTFRSEEEGFLFFGETPGMYAAWDMGILGLEIFHFEANRQQHRNNLKSGNSFFTGASLFGRFSGFRYQIGGLYYFFPGREALADLSLPVSRDPDLSVIIKPGRSALPDRGIQYYWANLDYHYNSFSTRLAGIFLNGEQRDGQTEFTRRTITGESAYFALRYSQNADFHLDRESEKAASHGHISPLPLSLMRSRSTFEAELGILATSRNREDSNGYFRGFDGIRPLPQVLGGELSILLTRPAVTERPPFQGRQPGSRAPAYSSDRFDPEGRIIDTRPRDNTDPAYPDYSNQGIRMGGLHLGFPGYVNTDLFVNYADYLTGEGVEIIVIVKKDFSPERWFFPDSFLYAGITVARYRPTLRIPAQGAIGRTEAAAARISYIYNAGISLTF